MAARTIKWAHLKAAVEMYEQTRVRLLDIAAEFGLHHRTILAYTKYRRTKRRRPISASLD